MRARTKVKKFVLDLARDRRDGSHVEGLGDAEGDAIEIITIHSAKVLFDLPSLLAGGRIAELGLEQEMADPGREPPVKGETKIEANRVMGLRRRRSAR
jgi:hypothetical protein